MARADDETPTAGPAPERRAAPGRTDVIVAKAVQAARATAQALPADNDSASIAALASIVNRALMLVGLVVLVLGGMVGVYLTVPGLGSASPAHGPAPASSGGAGASGGVPATGTPPTPAAPAGGASGDVPQGGEP